MQKSSIHGPCGVESQKLPKSAYYLIWTIPFLGIPKVAWNFPYCRNYKLIKCRRDWHKQMAPDGIGILPFLTPNFGHPLNNLWNFQKYAQSTPFCRPSMIPFLKKNFHKPDIIHLQSQPKREIWALKLIFKPQNPKRGAHNDLKILATPAFSPINTKKCGSIASYYLTIGS